MRPLILVVMVAALWPMATEAQGTEKQITSSIIERCRNQMGSFGASLVKVCVDQDINAYRSLQGYDPKHQPAIDRCRRQMLSIGGWDIVKVCADQDIEAERALRKY